jgi:branched-chain amino acid transport system ATP-binding protein
MLSRKEGRLRVLLEVKDVVVAFGGIRALDGVSFNAEENSIIGLIGPNGAGKTTLFNVVSGLYKPNSGSVTFAAQDVLALKPHQVIKVGIARTFQNVGLCGSLSVLENVMLGAYHRGMCGFSSAALGLPSHRRSERATRSDALEILRELDLEKHADSLAKGLPFGTLKRIELARALAAQPRMLMLDEPANGLTHGEVDELSAVIRRIRDKHQITILLVEHHMAMVMSLSDKVVALNFGKTLIVGNPDEVRQNPEVVAAYLGSAA